MIDVYGDITSVPPGIIRSDEDVAAIRQGRIAEQEAMERQAQLAQAAQNAKAMSEADMSGDNALTRVADTVQSEAV